MYMQKHLMTCGCILFSIMLVGCDNSAPQAPLASNSPAPVVPVIEKSPEDEFISQLKTNTEYKYYKDDSCTNSDSQVCMTLDQYKKICSVAEGVTKFATKVRAVTASHKEQVLLEGGGRDSIDVLWAKSNGGVEQCYAVMTISGIVDGNSAKEEIQGVASSFIKNDKGQVLVSYFSL